MYSKDGFNVVRTNKRKLEELEQAWYEKWGDHFNTVPFEEQRIELLYRLPEYRALMRARKGKDLE